MGEYKYRSSTNKSEREGIKTVTTLEGVNRRGTGPRREIRDKRWIQVRIHVEASGKYALYRGKNKHKRMSLHNYTAWFRDRPKMGNESAGISAYIRKHM